MPKHHDARSDPATLRRSIERALCRDEPASDVLPMLERLQSIAAEGTDERHYADRRLAELLLETEPWRAAVFIRRLVGRAPHEDANWALMGLAQALLGHHRFAAASYRRALAIDPGNPWYAHNLGHLLDVALDRPREALKWLELAHKRVPETSAITCSLVHALWRTGDLDAARKVLAPLRDRGRTDPDVSALAAQLDAPTRRAGRKKNES